MKFFSVAIFLAIFVIGGVSSSKRKLKGLRSPIISSGDLIGLRSTYRSHSTDWLYCKSKCRLVSCSDWPKSCAAEAVFRISAKAKMDGQPINSGDTVSLSSKGNHSMRLICGRSPSSKCSMQSTISSMSGDEWLTHIRATFQVFDKNVVDVTPVQSGDVVGFKYEYSSNRAWLTIVTGGSLNPRSCSSHNKALCAKKGTLTGFQIFKKL